MMHPFKYLFHIAIAMLLAALSGMTVAKLPPPTPEQAQAAAAQKAQADAQAEKEKQELAATMDAIAARWRARAAANGWQVHAPTPVAAVQGMNTTAAQSSPSGQPGGQQGSATAQAPVRSEKWGTAPPSADVKPDAPRSIR
jgi:hypothetical protein